MHTVRSRYGLVFFNSNPDLGSLSGCRPKIQISTMARLCGLSLALLVLYVFSVSIHPHVRHTWWTQTVGAFCITVVLIGINQAIVQKYLSIPKCRDAQK